MRRSTADAIIFCINTPLKDAEAEAVRLFRSGRAGLPLTGGTAIAVLTKADLLAAADRLTHDRRATWKKAIRPGPEACRRITPTCSPTSCP